MLPGIQALVQVMRSEVSEYLESDILAPCGVRFQNDLADPSNMSKSDGVQRACNTLVAESRGTPTDASLPVPDSTCPSTEPKPDVITSGLYASMNPESMNSSEAHAMQQAKPVYTVLTSKNKFHPTVSDTRSSGINELSNSAISSTSPSLRSNAVTPKARPNPDLLNTGPNELSNPTINSTCPSAFHKTPPTPAYAVLTSNAMCSSARSNPDPIIIGPNEPSKSPINPPAFYRTTWKLQKILPKPKISNANNSSSPTRRKLNPASSMLYQLLKRNTPSTAFTPVTSQTQPTSPNPIDAVPTSDKNNIFSPARPNPTSSMLHQLLNPTTTCHSMTSETPITSPNAIDAALTSNTKVSKTNCVITRKSHFQPTGPTPTLSNSGSNTIPNSNSSCSKSNPSTSQIQQKSPQCVPIVPKFPNTELPLNSSSAKRQNCCTKSVIKASKRCNSRKATTKPVESFVPRESSGCDECLSNVKVQLAREELWKLFYEQGNEMIVSKPGRPIFPTLDFSVSGLDPEEMYSIAVRLVCVDKYRYRYYTSLDIWEQTYEDKHQPGHPRCFEHPQSPANGQTWSAKLLTFTELRLTNRATKAENMVYAPTMRKHRFQLVVTMLRCSRCHAKHTRYIDVPLTDFIGVSSYYSLAITKRKIAHNPLAKTRGLNGQRKRKSCNHKSSEDVPTLETKKQKTGDDPVNPPLNNSSESTHVTMSSNKHVSTTASTQLSTIPDLNTSSILQSTSNSQFSTVPPFVPPNVLQSTSSSLYILPSTSSSQLPPISSQVTSGIKPARHCLPSSTTTYPQSPVIKATENPKMLSRNNLTPMERCDTVYTCQTTKPTAHVQTDDDILEYIKIYLSPFLTTEKNEALDSSVFDELFNINPISEKLDKNLVECYS